MNQKELNEIRRHLTADRNCIGKIYGCFVNCAGEIITYTETSMALMPEDEVERFLALFKKSLSGGIGRCLLDIPFSTAQVESSEEHALLMKLRSTHCADEEARKQFFANVIAGTDLKDTNYLILLCTDSYDVPWRSKDGEDSDKQSDTMFTYLLCCVCPVHEGKTELGYVAGEKTFQNCTAAQGVSAPEFGFMFPAFDGRRANIYSALYYSRSIADVHQGFIESFFHAEAPMSAGVQRDTFESILTETLEENCSFDVVQTVHEQIRERLEQHKEAKIPDPPELTAREVGDILRSAEVPDDRIEKFRKKCTEAFGAGASLNPSNIVDVKNFRLTLPQIKISVAPEASYLVESRVIDGRKYLLIPVSEGVEVNGVAVHIPTQEKE